MTTRQLEQSVSDSEFLESLGIQLLGETRQQAMQRLAGYREDELRARCVDLQRETDITHYVNAELRGKLKLWRMYASASIGLTVWLILLVVLNK